MAKRCNSIIISECPPDDTCETCKEIIKSQCVKYTGEDLDILGIENGDTLSQILVKLEAKFSELSGN
jgi:hypothetical protein